MPLDLLILIEIGKLFYTSMMESDVHMTNFVKIPLRHKEYAMIEQNFEAHTMNLHEELGNIDYIFADKTGTLTQNELVFK